MIRFIGRLFVALTFCLVGYANAALIPYDIAALIDASPGDGQAEYWPIAASFLADDTLSGEITGLDFSEFMPSAGTTIYDTISNFDPTTLQLQLTVFLQLDFAPGLVAIDFGNGVYSRPIDEVVAIYPTSLSPYRDAYSGYDLGFFGTFSVTGGEVSVSTPATVGLFGLGLAGLALTRRGKSGTRTMRKTLQPPLLS